MARRQPAGTRRAGWRLAAGGWRLAAGGWRLAAGGWRTSVTTALADVRPGAGPPRARTPPRSPVR
ncbi:hypothetical protein DEI91_05590 [Curtobacterium sp. MCBD17_032]|nr:hypothetical protein DEI91_05590 [Curtobacterium sp. MCBD17_032]